MKNININKQCDNVNDKATILGNVLGSVGNNQIRSNHISWYWATSIQIKGSNLNFFVTIRK